MADPSLVLLVKGSLTSHRTIASTEERGPMTQISKDGQHVGGSEVVRLRPCFRVLFGHWVGQLLLSLGFLLEMHAPRVMRVSLSGQTKVPLLF
jgi:hypothetical protein